MSRIENEQTQQSDKTSELNPLSAKVSEDGAQRHSFVRPAQKHWYADDYRRPVPQDAIVGSRLSPCSTISFPHNRFKTSMAVRASMLPYIEQDIPLDGGSICRLCNLPLYAIGQVMKP